MLDVRTERQGKADDDIERLHRETLEQLTKEVWMANNLYKIPDAGTALATLSPLDPDQISESDRLKAMMP